MTNYQVYKKTLSFSFISFFAGIIELVLVIGLSVGGYFLMDKSNDMAIIGLVIGLIIGLVLVALIHIFVINRIKAAQVGMMAKGVVDDTLPENVVSQGLAEVQGRFAKITLFFMVVGAIKGIFRQIGRSINKAGRAIGGDVGDGITSAIDSAIQVLIGYLSDCCLGWVMYQKEKGVVKAACEGAVIFFKHGKTLIRNIGRIFGMGLLSFVLVGGAFFGISYLIFSHLPQIFTNLANEIAEIGVRNSSEIPEFLTNPTTLTLVVCGIIGVLIWSMLHSLLIRPFILVGVLRNYMNSGLNEQITEADMQELENKSPRFAKLRNKEA